MIGICPHCKIDLKKPPFGERETNEVIIVMKYRSIIDSNSNVKSIEEIGYCEVCNASIDDLKKQMQMVC